MLTCDQTFDCLTDPIHRHNESVEQHLDACPRCRDMADALEPALDLFGEVNEVETWQLPMASGEYELEEQPRVDRAPAGAAPRPWARGYKRSTRLHNDGLTIAVFLVLISTMAAALVNVGRDDESAAAVAIQLPPNCQRTEPTKSDADNVIAGCVACHLKMAALADMEPMHRQHAQTLVNRCVECHLEIAMHSTDTDVAISRTADPASHSLLANCLFGRGS
jgi:hypothetical protein